MAEAMEFPVTIRVDAEKPAGELRPIWRFFGYDEPNFTYMKDGKKLLAELGRLSTRQTVFIRTHNLLTTGDGTPALKWGSTNAYTEDAHGRPVYDWTLVDRIFDTYLERGLKPYVQIGFMPEALSVKPQPYRHDWVPGVEYGTIYTGWAYPPTDYARWAELVYRWTQHCVERYGQDETLSWYWEVWNEPDIGYWQGTPEEYHRLYDHAVHAVRRALPGARVGGPETTGPRGQRAAEFLRGFLEHCVRGTNHATGETGSPLDFIAFHAKGAPRFVDGHVQMGLSAQLSDVDRGFEIVASFPEFRNTPIIIGECDPDGCAACSARIYPQNDYRNGTLFASYTAASFARIQDLADKRGVNLEGALTWAFEFEDQPFFAGFRVLASNGIDLPVLNVFRMFGRMGGRRISVESSADTGAEALRREGVRGAAPDVSALASLDGKTLYVLLWHYHDDALPGPDAAVTLTLSGVPFADGAAAKLEHYRIDEENSNAFRAWTRMGSPQSPTPEQYARLEEAGRLAPLGEPEVVRVEDRQAIVWLTLPRQAVSLLVFAGEP